MEENVTIAIDADLLMKARKIAIERNTTLQKLIRQYLKGLVEQKEAVKSEIVAELEGLFNHSHLEVGDVNWSRNDFHER